MTAELIGALRGISERLGQLEDDRARPAATPSLDAKPEAPGEGKGGVIDDDLLVALRARRDAFADVVDADRGGASLCCWAHSYPPFRELPSSLRRLGASSTPPVVLP